MKKIVLTVAMLCAMTAAKAQNVETFLNRYKQLVETVESRDSIGGEEKKAFKETYDKLTTEYHDTYKEKMNNDELELYMEYRTRYRRRFARDKAELIGERIDSAGVHAWRGVKKAGSKASGVLKGIFKRNKNKSK